MLKFYSNRELSEKLGINLAKWKRWSRELLPPDPLGGLQSGYARQYNPADAFTVCLGGHLISDLKYTIPESKQILTDLHNWLVQGGFFFDPVHSDSNPEIQKMVRSYQVLIQQNTEAINSHSGFRYQIRGIIATQPAEYKSFSVNQEFWIETVLPEGESFPPPHLWDRVKLLNISAVQTRFLTALNFQNGSK